MVRYEAIVSSEGKVMVRFSTGDYNKSGARLKSAAVGQWVNVGFVGTKETARFSAGRRESLRVFVASLWIAQGIIGIRRTWGFRQTRDNVVPKIVNLIAENGYDQEHNQCDEGDKQGVFDQALPAFWVHI
jgi:hypothetical protein